MITKSRIASIADATSLDASITGIQTFHLAQVDVAKYLNFDLPTNLRLGHLAEKVVSGLIKASPNYGLLLENVQVVEDGKTIGEIDFIIEELLTKQIIHLELAYKFYLLDPSISSEQMHNWIGPNRNDSLKEKLEKITTKQFPLLYHKSTSSHLGEIEPDKVSQVLCLLASLFVPYGYKSGLNPAYEAAIRGYYINYETFTSLDDTTKAYYLPEKKEWGIDPSGNKRWTDLSGVEKRIGTCMEEKQAPLCWQKHQGSFEAFFIVWW